MKIAGLRTQLRHEIAKTNSWKSRQATSEKYKSTWVFYDKLHLLRSVTQACKSKDNLCPDQELLNDTQDEFDQESLSSASPTCSEILEPTPRISKKVRKFMEARKENFLLTCVTVLRETTRPQSQPVPIKEQSLFSKYVSEKLHVATFDRKSRMIAGKRISDILLR